MDPFTPQFLQQALVAVLVCSAAALIPAIVVVVIALRQISEMEIPPDADFFETLQLVPISVPIALDLLDLAFGIFSAPFSWMALELMGLRALRMVTIVESIMPGMGPIPTMTIAWAMARWMKKTNRKSPLRDAMREYQTRGMPPMLGGRSAHDVAARYRGQSLGEPTQAMKQLPPPPRRTASMGDIPDSSVDEPMEGAIDGEYYEEDDV
jgi:hypothetical protein